MNTRIEELVTRAGGYVSCSYEHDGNLILSGKDDIDRFATLIIDECVNIVLKGELVEKTTEDTAYNLALLVSVRNICKELEAVL